jgi:two-component sensor histidine kinase
MTKIEAQLYTVASMHGLEAAGHDGISLGNLIRSVSENTQSLFGRAVNVDMGEKRDRMWSLRLRETESVPLALALNELLVNAHKHGTDAPLEIRAMPHDGGAIIEIANEVAPGARVPDLRAVAENGGGLGLVLALLPQENANLEFEHSGSRVSAILRLRHEVFSAAFDLPPSSLSGIIKGAS